MFSPHSFVPECAVCGRIIIMGPLFALAGTRTQWKSFCWFILPCLSFSEHLQEKNPLDWATAPWHFNLFIRPSFQYLRVLFKPFQSFVQTGPLNVTSIFKLIQSSKCVTSNWRLFTSADLKWTIFGARSAGSCPASVTSCWTKFMRETCSQMCCSSSSRTCSASGMTSKSSSWAPRSTQRSSPSTSVGNAANISWEQGKINPA